MAFTESEVAPLVGGRRISPADNNATNIARRRTGPQHNPSVQGTYVTSNEDFSKKPERRGTCSQCCYRVCRVVCAKPQIDTTALYYEDSFNDEPWECTFGTADEDGIWVNHSDKVGTMMSAIVWVLMGYSMVTISWLAQNNNLSNHIAMTYGTICSLALASHAKTMFTDPGAIPMEAVPLASLFKQGITTHAMCSHCQTYKPPNSHHCRICNRCISRMDHHCPWMNNCVGAGNFKHFILFLIYTWIGCTFALIIFALNYFFCDNEDCMFSPILIHLVRIMTFLCLATLLFVSSMLMNVTYGIMTGIGTIDRLKKKASGTLHDSLDDPIKLKEVFGIQGYWTWALPMDPIFEDHDRVMGYSTPQRLQREQQREGKVGYTNV